MLEIFWAYFKECLIPILDSYLVIKTFDNNSIQARYILYIIYYVYPVWAGAKSIEGFQHDGYETLGVFHSQSSKEWLKLGPLLSCTIANDCPRGVGRSVSPLSGWVPCRDARRLRPLRRGGPVGAEHSERWRIWGRDRAEAAAGKSAE